MGLGLILKIEAGHVNWYQLLLSRFRGWQLKLETEAGSGYTAGPFLFTQHQFVGNLHETESENYLREHS